MTCALVCRGSSHIYGSRLEGNSWKSREVREQDGDVDWGGVGLRKRLELTLVLMWNVERGHLAGEVMFEHTPGDAQIWFGKGLRLAM